LNIKVTGELKKDIESGSKVYLNVQAGFIKKDFEFDVCNTLVEYKDKIKGAEPLTCPIKAGKKTWEENIVLPDYALPAVSLSSTSICEYESYQRPAPQQYQRARRHEEQRWQPGDLPERCLGPQIDQYTHDPARIFFFLIH
jgi:hypothetical protein